MTRYNGLYVVSVVCLQYMVLCCQACTFSKYPCILNGTEGNISTPNYPSNYPNYANVSWLIQVPPTYTVKLSFQDFNVEHSVNCEYDHVTIYDGQFITGSPVLGKYCGHFKPPNQFSTGIQLQIVFISDLSDGYLGFIGSYEAIKEVSSCSSNHSNVENTNIIVKESPGTLLTSFNSNLTNVQCLWKLRAPKGYGIRVTFSSMSFLNNMTCSDGSIELYGGYFVRNEGLIQRFCGDNSFLSHPNVKYNPHRTAMVQLQVSHPSSWTLHSFVASYEFIKKDTKSCSSFNNNHENNNIRLSSHHGNLTFNTSDWHDVQCRWQISAPKDKQTKLTFLDFSLDWTKECQKSYVQIFDGDVDRGKFCGKERPWVIFSSSGILYVKFVVSKTNKVSWFTAMYETVSKALGRCSTINSNDMNSNIHLENPSGLLMTPNYPSNYPANHICIWIITVPIDYRVRLHFKSFELEEYNCQYDFVEIRDGGSSSSPVKENRLCGDSSVPRDVYSSSNKLWVKFRSDHNDHMKGFLASYNSVLPEPSICSLANSVEENNNIKINAYSGFLVSPNYPHPYPPEIKCTWRVTVPKGQFKLIVQFLEFNLDPQCDGYLTLYDKSCLCNNIGKHCGNDTPIAVVSSGSSVKVVFQAGSTNYFGRFNLSFHVPIRGPEKCSVAFPKTINDNLYLNNTRGQVTSPEYPLPYTPGTQCTWQARAPPGFRVQLSMTKMDLPMPCVADYLAVYDGISRTSPLIGKICFVKNTKRIYSSGERMLLKFVSHRSLNRAKHQGFEANYRMILASNCSKDFDETWNTNLKLGESKFGVFSSPKYPQFYPADIRCTWKITVSHGYRVKLRLISLSLGKPCSTDLVEVRDGLHSSSSRLAKFCGSVTHGSEITSSGRYLSVHFESGKNSSLGTGFQASFTAINYDSQDSESTAKVIIISLVTFACFALITISAIFIYWVYKRTCRQRRHSDPPSHHDVTALSSLPPPTLDDIPACLIAEDRPPSYSEAINNEDDESTTEVPLDHQGDQLQTPPQQLRYIERGIDNQAFTNDPPSYESLYRGQSI